MNNDEFEDLVFVWKQYGLADDETLSKGAKKLKHRVNNFVKSLPKFESIFVELKKNEG